LITLVNIIICFLAGFIYETRFSSLSPFPVNGLTTFYHCSDDLFYFSLICVHGGTVGNLQYMLV